MTHKRLIPLYLAVVCYFLSITTVAAERIKIPKGEFDGCGDDRTQNRGKRMENAFGVFNMHENAGEWIQNWYAKDAITKYFTKGILTSPEKGVEKVVLGMKIVTI